MDNTHETCSLASRFEHKLFTVPFVGSRYHSRMNDKSLGERLKRHRTSHPKISTYDLAKAAKYITAAGITNKERGIRKISKRDAEILAEAFSRLGKPVTPLYLLGMDDNASVQYSGGSVNAEILADCIRIFEEMLPPSEVKIPPETKAKIIEGMYRRVRPDGSIHTADVIELIKPITDRYTRWDHATGVNRSPARVDKRRGEPGKTSRVRKLRR